MNLNFIFYTVVLSLILGVGCSKDKGSSSNPLSTNDEVIEVEVSPVEDPGNQPVLPPPVANTGVFSGNWKGKVEAISMGTSVLCDSEFRVSQDDIAFVLAYILYDCGDGDVLESDRAIRFMIDEKDQLVFEGSVVGKIESENLLLLDMQYQGTHMKLNLEVKNDLLKIIDHTFTANGFDILKVENQNLQRQN